MSDHVYKTIELTGTSSTSIDEAVSTAIQKAAKTIHDLRWFEVTEIRGGISQGTVAHWQVCMKVGFTLEE